MAWLWSSANEYKEYVCPVVFNKHTKYIMYQKMPWSTIRYFLINAAKLVDTERKTLADMIREKENTSLPDLKSTTLCLIDLTEELLFFHKRLALTKAAHGFLSQKDLIEHWDRYVKTNRIYYELEQLLKDIDELMVEYYKLLNEDEELLVDGLQLPEYLMADFILARNLLSVGFDDVGILIAARGFEGVLRAVAQKKGIYLKIKEKKTPLQDADMHDVIEALHRIRWRSTKKKIIDVELKHLLHYLRSIRNSVAHSVNAGRAPIIRPREMASLIGDTANNIWKEASIPRARIDTKVVDKSW
ncbi:MAG: hypothetical protein WC899_12095 [bacterium]|jgi:hypothetical protein